MLEIHLVRHGETPWNREGRWQGQSDTPLSELGRAQAAAVGRRLGRHAFDMVYSSDLIRARDTARIALPAHEPVLDERLRELHFGDWEGKSWRELLAEHGELIARWHSDPTGFSPPGGESYTSLVTRVRSFVAALPETGRVAVFAHGGVLRAFVFSLTGEPEAGTWGVRFDNGGITRIEKRAGVYVIAALNETAHLENLAREASGDIG